MRTSDALARLNYIISECCALKKEITKLETNAKVYYSPGEAAEIAGVNASTISRWIADGKLSRTITSSGRKAIPAEEVQRIVELREERDAMAATAEIYRRKGRQAKGREMPEKEPFKKSWTEMKAEEDAIDAYEEARLAAGEDFN